MSEVPGYKDIERKGIDKLLRRSGHNVAAYCVVTTDDDLVLVQKRTIDDEQGLVVKRVMITDPDRVEETISENEYIVRFKDVGGAATSQAATVEFLGSYRFVPPSGKELALPFAVELDVPSADLDIVSHRYEWVDFDWLDTFLTEHETPNSAGSPEAHHALRQYLDTMTFEEVQTASPQS